jgi:hypothetical protein
MMTAARKLQSVGLAILMLAIFGLIYPLSLQVATTRSDVMQVEREILRTRENIRYLETELGARASMRQLERWNAEVFGYAAPTASQYLAGEQELASVNSRQFNAQQNGAKMPIVAPVLTAMAQGAQGAQAADGQNQAPQVQGLQIAQQVAAPQPRIAPVVMATRNGAPDRPVPSIKLVPEANAATPKAKAKPASGAAASPSLGQSAQQRRVARAAMLEDQLLSPETFAQIERGAKAERTAKPKPAAAQIKPAAAKLAVARPVASKPVASKPVVSKPSLSKPVAAKPGPAKPQSAKASKPKGAAQ